MKISLEMSKDGVWVCKIEGELTSPQFNRARSALRHEFLNYRRSRAVDLRAKELEVRKTEVKKTEVQPKEVKNG